MSRRIPGSLLLMVLALGLFYTRPVWAGSNGEQVGTVLVRVSPLTLLLQNDVTIKVGEFTCHLVNGVDPASQCSNLPPGEYQVTAESEGYIVVPPSYQLTIPGGDANNNENNNDTNSNDQDEEEEDEDTIQDAQSVPTSIQAGSIQAGSIHGESIHAGSNSATEYYFRLYQIRNQLFLPNVQAAR